MAVSEPDRYQTIIDKAHAYEQVQTAMNQGHVETPNQEPPSDSEYLTSIRNKAASAVYSYWNEKHRAAPLGEIFLRVRTAVNHDDKWHGDWKVPSKRTVDRRVNEAADIRFYKTEGQTPIVAVRAGYYIPNPRRFEGTARTILEALLQ